MKNFNDYREDNSSVTKHWNELIYNSRPHPVLKKDWSSYTSLQFANAFLPYVKGYISNSSIVYDGAKLFDGLKKSYRQDFRYMSSDELTQVTTFTFPKGVLASKRKYDVLPLTSGLCMFIEVDKSDEIEITFKFGSHFKKILKETEFIDENTSVL